MTTLPRSRPYVQLPVAIRSKLIIHCARFHQFHDVRSGWPYPAGDDHRHQRRVATSYYTNAWSVFKLNVAVPMLKMVTNYLNPQWGLEAPTRVAKLIRLLVNLTHHECDNPVCKQVSFTYGSGFPALWRHENLNDATHEWLKHEFGNVPMRFFQQMARCVKQGNMISFEGFRELPADFCAQAPQTDARFAFLAGRRNRCFSTKVR